MTGYESKRAAARDKLDDDDTLTIAYQSGYYDGKKAAQPAQEPVAKYCCYVCFDKSGQTFLDRMILCSECGNKRCPKATNHALPCTNSNNPLQPAQEPVAWLCSPDENGLFELPTTHKACKDCFPVYTTPPQRKPLTDEELDLICEKALFCRISFQQFARSIEAAHGIKENT